jgi:hypothetical protein
MVWPNFFVVGAQKAGTTSVYEYLKLHPQVYMSPVKEPHFFSSDLVRIDSDLVFHREADYLRLFEGAEGFRVVGEASPCYLWHPEVARRIRDRIPEARIVILLRDPVERAYSHYLMDIMDGGLSKPFYELITEEFRRGEKVFGTGHLYVELGQYFRQVRRYVEAFGYDQVLVLMFEDLVHCPFETAARVAGFLGLDQEPTFNIPSIGKVHVPYMKPRNPLVPHLMRLRKVRMLWRHVVPASIRYYVRHTFLAKQGPKPPMDPSAAAFLQSIYEPDIQALETLLGRSLPALRKTWG